MHSAVPPSHASAHGAEERLTPVLLTALSTGLALMPVAWQLHQPGHEIEGPMAVVILGGLVSSAVEWLLLVPPLAIRWLRPGPRHRRVQRRGTLPDNSPGGLDREKQRERQ